MKHVVFVLFFLTKCDPERAKIEEEKKYTQ